MTNFNNDDWFDPYDIEIEDDHYRAVPCADPEGAFKER